VACKQRSHSHLRHLATLPSWPRLVKASGFQPIGESVAWTRRLAAASFPWGHRLWMSHSGQSPRFRQAAAETQSAREVPGEQMWLGKRKCSKFSQGSPFPLWRWTSKDGMVGGWETILRATLGAMSWLWQGHTGEVAQVTGSPPKELPPFRNTWIDWEQYGFTENSQNVKTLCYLE
jgi:hypothetical protein